MITLALYSESILQGSGSAPGDNGDLGHDPESRGYQYALSDFRGDVPSASG